jgi:hypothetical protein
LQEEIAARKKEWELDQLRARLEEERNGQDSDADDILTISRETAMNQVKKPSNTSSRRHTPSVSTRENMRSSPNKHDIQTLNTKQSTRKRNPSVKQTPSLSRKRINQRETRAPIEEVSPKLPSRSRSRRTRSPAARDVAVSTPPHKTRYGGHRNVSYDELESDLTEDSSQDTVITPIKPVVKNDKQMKELDPNPKRIRDDDGSYWTQGKDGRFYRVGQRDSSGKFIKKTPSSSPAKPNLSPPKRVRINADPTRNGVDSDSGSRKSSGSPSKGTSRSRSSSNSSQKLDVSLLKTTPKNNGNAEKDDSETLNNLTNGNAEAVSRRASRSRRLEVS